MNNKLELENVIKAMSSLSQGCAEAAKVFSKLSKVAGIRPIPRLNFYHRCKLRVCRWFGLSTDWKIKNKIRVRVARLIPILQQAFGGNREDK